MAISVRKVGDAMLFALVQSFNALKKELAGKLAVVHADVTSKAPTGDFRAPAAAHDLVLAADATDLASIVALANAEKAVMNRHFADKIAHKDADDPVTTAAATDLASAVALLNALKAALNGHDADTGVHYAADATNTVTADDATDLATAETLANQLKGKLNSHIEAGITTASLDLIEA